MVDLKLFRETNNLLQKDLAEFLGVSIAFISSIEKGQAKLPSDKLVKLLDNDRIPCLTGILGCVRTMT